jgi:hypothetical protein
MEQINARIKQEICYNTLQELTDEKLLPVYKETASAKKEIDKLSHILKKYTDDETSQNIVREYLLQFNSIVKTVILELALDPELFDVCFEKACDGHVTTEIPDWYILQKSTNKIIIGMNQLDLWGGGQQSNRGSKYILDNVHNNENSKLLCVVCNQIQFTSKKNKTYKLFEIGFRDNTLCYLMNLPNIITSYFTIKAD